jgi:protoheme IX farnesyltransferase
VQVSTALLESAPAVESPRLARARAYISLTKPRIIELLLVTTVPAMMLAQGGFPPLWLMAVVLVGGSLAAGGSSAINCYLDRDIDPLMGRTSRRPLVTHTIAPRNALIFGLALATGSVVLMAAFTNPLATLLTAAAIIYYDLIYTAWLKRTTKHKHLLGRHLWGDARADRLGGRDGQPETVGVAAFRGCVLLADAALLCAGNPVPRRLRPRGDSMLPVVATPLHVARDAVVYAWLTVLTSVAAWPFGMSIVYGVPALICGGMFLPRRTDSTAGSSEAKRCAQCASSTGRRPISRLCSSLPL